MQVKLREVVEYVTGIIAQNAVGSSVQHCIHSKATAAAASIREQAENPIRQALARVGPDAKAAAVADHARLLMADALDQLTAAAAHQVRQRLSRYTLKQL